MYLQSAILSAVIFNALIIVALIPLALKGCLIVLWAAAAAAKQPADLWWGTGCPFVGIKLIDMILMALGLA
jgi:K+-transporting ATPase ATPase B chain